MLPKTDDVRIESLHPLVAPVILMEDLKAGPSEMEFVAAQRSQAASILKGDDPRLLVVVGPCSIHDRDQALEYGAKLGGVIDKYRDTLQIMMRVYFEKPRTTVGWKGFINDPDLDESYDINKGLRLARGLLLDLVKQGVPAGTEFLDTISPQYIADLVTWGAIGARTTESQIHRELASGLSMPVGFKNGTAGSIGIAVDAIRSSQSAHRFLSVTKQGVSAIVTTRGNDSCHVILRGGKAGPNFDEASVAGCVEQLVAAGLPPHVMVDCSHGNSMKDYRKQPEVAESIAATIEGGGRAITGVMIESHLVEGNQKVIEGQELVRGQSITDACVSWETTEAMLERLSSAVATRNANA